MFHIHSVTGRIVIGKSIGFAIGLLIMLALPTFDMPIVSMFGLGTLLMFILMGAMTGFMGLFDRHPLFQFKLPWWIRGGAIGFVFMLMYILLTYNTFIPFMQSSLVSWTGLSSPFWALIDGTVIGMLMSFVETKFAGEGKDLPLT
jgi:hypothetical protein